MTIRNVLSTMAAALAAFGSPATGIAQQSAEPPKRIEFDEFLVIAGDDIAREFATCAGYYAIWAATVQNQGNEENAGQLRDITQYAIDAATEAARGVRDDEDVNDFVRGYVLDTANSINTVLSRPDAEWSTVYEIYDDACKWALDNQEQAIEQWTARTAARLREQGYELGEPPPESDQ